MWKKNYDLIFTEKAVDDLRACLPKRRKKILTRLLRLERVSSFDNVSKSSLTERAFGDHKMYTRYHFIYYDVTYMNKIVVLHILPRNFQSSYMCRKKITA